MKRWQGQTVTVDVWDLHVLLALASTARVLPPTLGGHIDCLNRLVDRCNAAKEKQRVACLTCRAEVSEIWPYGDYCSHRCAS